MFNYLHNGTYHDDTREEYMAALGLDKEAQEAILNQKKYEEHTQAITNDKNSKRQGAVINGVQISLNETNQNGIASVLTALGLADEVGAALFPLSFNAETATGVVSMPFADLAAFKQFALQFMSARQVFFN